MKVKNVLGAASIALTMNLSAQVIDIPDYSLPKWKCNVEVDGIIDDNIKFTFQKDGGVIAPLEINIEEQGEWEIGPKLAYNYFTLDDCDPLVRSVYQPSPEYVCENASYSTLQVKIAVKNGKVTGMNAILNDVDVFDSTDCFEISNGF